MSAMERFRLAWHGRFPSEQVPDMPCLQAGHDTSVGGASDQSSVYGTVYSGVNVLAVEQALKACNERIEQLHRQVEQQQFIADHLWSVYHGLNSIGEESAVPTAPLVVRHPKKPTSSSSSRIRKEWKPPVVPLETDIDAPAGPPPPTPVDTLDSLDSIVPLSESGSFSPVTPDDNDDKQKHLLPGSAMVSKQTDVNADVKRRSLSSGCQGSSVQGGEKPRKPSMRKHSLPLLDNDRDGYEDEVNAETVSLGARPSFLADDEYLPMSSADYVRMAPAVPTEPSPPSLPLSGAGALIGPPGSSIHMKIGTTVSLPGTSGPPVMNRSSPNCSPSLSPGNPARRPKPVPTPRVTVNKTASSASCKASTITLEGIDVSSSSTEDRPPSGSGDIVQQLTAEPKRIGSNAGSHHQPPKITVQFNVGQTICEAAETATDDGKSVPIKDRVLAFSSFVHDSNRLQPQPPPPAAEVTAAESDAAAQRRAKRKQQETTTYEVPAPFKRENADSDEAGAVSSDDEEPLYYNLMMLQKHVLNRAQTWYAKAGRHAAEAGAAASGAKANADGGDNPMQRSPVPNRRRQQVKETPSNLSSESVRSTDSNDGVFDDKLNGQSTSPSWRKRRSLFCATDSPGSQSESDELDPTLPICPEDEKLQMRKWVITSVLESEKTYLGVLDILMQYMQTFRNLLGSAQSVLSQPDIEVIFYGIPELHKAHKFFVHELEPCVAHWSAEQQIAEMFKSLSQTENKIAAEYLKNYQKAVVTIRRCWQENEKFAGLTKEIQVKGMKEKPSLEELLHKPVVRFQRNTLVLHDLVKCTPTSHADYDLLQKTLTNAQHFIENFDGSSYKDNPENQRYVAKQGMIVEKVGTVRKLRHIFLFNDVLVCARQKISKQRITFEAKWHIPLIDLTLDDKVDAEEEKQLADCRQQEIEQLQRKVSELQGELKTEIKQSRTTDSEAHRNWSFHNRTKNTEKIRKKLMEQQAAMIKASPRLLFRVHNRRNGRQYTLLMASDYERTNWRFTIAGLLSRAQSAFNVSIAEIQNLLNSQKLPKNPLGNLIGSDDINLEEELLYGSLNITIFRLQGLKQTCDAYCTVEVDSFGHFFVKAKTNICTGQVEPTWNQEFDVDLEGAQTVRILCYRQNRDVWAVIGTCALELSKAWLRGDFLEKTISLNDETSLTISLRYSSRDQTIKRSVSNVKGCVFGARIKTVAKREGTNIPVVVAACAQEVTERGMDEVGIYRISGVAGDIQKLKKAFDKNSKIAVQTIKEVDVHVLTGLLKLYFRELPEALFTDALYPNLVTGMGFSDPEAKEKYLQSLFVTLPEPNHSTAIFLIDHLISVAEREAENKMSLQNLATVFGPTLLRPAVKGTEAQTMEELFSSGARDAMLQTSILMVFFNLRKKGVAL